MIAPRYVGASTTTVSPRSRNVLPTSSSASIAPLVISSSSSSSGRRPCSDSMRVASASSGPASPRVGAYWNAETSPRRRELLQQCRGALARERQRIGKAARERDQSRHAEEREHLRDPVAHVGARPRREQRLPLRRRHRHVRHSRRSACAASRRRARAPAASRRSSRRGRTRTTRRGRALASRARARRTRT